jgi:hypothetical protein
LKKLLDAEQERAQKDEQYFNNKVNDLLKWVEALPSAEMLAEENNNAINQSMRSNVSNRLEEFEEAELEYDDDLNGNNSVRTTDLSFSEDDALSIQSEDDNIYGMINAFTENINHKLDKEKLAQVTKENEVLTEEINRLHAELLKGKPTNNINSETDKKIYQLYFEEKTGDDEQSAA